MADALNGTVKAESNEGRGRWAGFGWVERAVFQWVAAWSENGSTPPSATFRQWGPRTSAGEVGKPFRSPPEHVVTDPWNSGQLGGIRGVSPSVRGAVQVVPPSCAELVGLLRSYAGCRFGSETPECR